MERPIHAGNYSGPTVMKRGAPKAAFRTITLCGDQGVLYSGPTSGLPIRESVILAKSVEFFADPEPCMIHRSAVQVRLYSEFELWLDDQGAGSEYSAAFSALPCGLQAYLDFRQTP